MATSPAASYTTSQIYQAIPQVLQDTDAANGYALWSYIYGVCKTLDNIDVLTFDNIGAGVTVVPTTVTPIAITPAKLAAAIDDTETAISVFGTDSTWNQINSDGDFVLQIEDEEIYVPAGAPLYPVSWGGVAWGDQGWGDAIPVYSPIPGGFYDWTSANLVFVGVTRGYGGTTPTAHAASSGANGSVDLKDYAGAVGWSQILDINRCPEYALPWLGQFVGANLAQTNGLTYQQALAKIRERSGFQRATVPSVTAEIVAIINSQVSGGAVGLSPGQVIVLENTAPLGSGGANLFAAIASTDTALVLTHTGPSWGTLGGNGPFIIRIDSEDILIPQGTYDWELSPVAVTGATRNYSGTGAAAHAAEATVSVIGGSGIYGFNEYAITILIPSEFDNVYTYAALTAAAGGAGTYAAVDAFIDTLGGIYADLASSPFPTSLSPYVNFIYRYRPAGLRVFVGAY